MIINSRVKLGTINYYVSCNCVYKKKNGHTYLCLKDYHDDYYDGGDLRCLLKELEKEYNSSNRKKYDATVGFLDDALYLYDNIPFISGVGDMYFLSKDNTLCSISYFSKEELDQYIKENNIKMSDQSNFKLYDGRTWLTYQGKDEKE